jgi:hypothetical protein
MKKPRHLDGARPGLRMKTAPIKDIHSGVGITAIRLNPKRRIKTLDSSVFIVHGMIAIFRLQ